MRPRLNSKYWSDLYQAKESHWDAGTITTPLKTYFDQLKNKELRILIPGAGNSYEAEYLVNKGFPKVYVCDYAKEPLDNLLKRCPEIRKSHLLHQNFFDINTDRKRPLRFDLVVEQTFFCALNPSLRKKYFKKMSELLVPGGKLVGVLFNHEFDKDTPPYGGTREKYLKLIPKTFKVKVLENCYNSIKPRQGRELFMILGRI